MSVASNAQPTRIIAPESDQMPSVQQQMMAAEAVNQSQATIAQMPDGQQLVLDNRPQVSPELALSLLLSSSKTGGQIAEILDAHGGIVCSHDLSTEDGIRYATMLLGVSSQRIQEVPDGTILQINAWLICAANKVQENGEVDDFVAISFATETGVVRSSSHWVRRTLGMMLRSDALRPWKPINVKVQRRPLTKGSMITLAYVGPAFAPSPNTEEFASGKKTKVRA